MADAKSLEAEAEALSEQGDYEAALLKYRAAALHDRPTAPLLWNLTFATEVAHIAYLRQLVEKYPASTAVQMQLARSLRNARQRASVVKVCTDLLACSDLTLADELAVRWMRIDTVPEGGLPDNSYANTIFVEDFTRLWSVGGEAEWAVRSRMSLLRVVARVTQPFMISAIEALIPLVSPVPSAVTLLELRVKELAVLAEAAKALEQIS